MNEAAGLATSWYDVAVPVILLVLMISMGSELVPADFKRVALMPRATLVGLSGQMLVLPLVGLGFAHWPGFAPEVALGIVIITACPGGAASNIFSYLARANVALSVTLTSISCVLCFVSIPFWIGLGLDLFGAGLAASPSPVELPFASTAARLFAVTLLPVAIGMAIRAAWPTACERLRPVLRRSTAALMAATIVVIVASEWDEVMRNAGASTLAALLLVCTMLALAHVLGRASRLDERDAFTVAIEVGLQNGALATMIVTSILHRPELIVFPGAYALVSFGPVAVFTLVMRRRRTKA